MTENQPQCIHCERKEDEVPLISMRYAGQQLWICPQHLPVLIHKPQQLAEKLPGAANLSPHSHD
jgi:hypothetical protein